MYIIYGINTTLDIFHFSGPKFANILIYYGYIKCGNEDRYGLQLSFLLSSNTDTNSYANYKIYCNL